jgi:glycosyltransferase involved in cell wall biosynthesis
VDKELFRYRPIRAKKKRIAILTRKNPKDTAFIYQGISARAQQGLNRLQGYTWFFVSINSEKELAKILSESLIFLFLSYSEGFGILPLEAMLSGAIVVAYNTGPYLEYLNHTNSCLVDIANRLEVIKKVEAIADAFHTQKEALARISRNAYKTAIKYSLEREEKSLLSFWREVIRSEK